MRNPGNFRGRGRLLLVSIAILSAAVLASIPTSSGSDPNIIDNLDGTKTAVWDFENPSNYTHPNVALDGGLARLERINKSFVDTLTGDFLSAEGMENITVTAGGEIELSGNAGDLVSTGDFSSDGPWVYSSSPDGNVTAARNATAENVVLSHQSWMTDDQFDSMDDISGSGWLQTGSLGTIVMATQENSNYIEGSGSANISYDQIAPANPARWGGIARSLVGGEDWSTYNTIVLQADTNLSGPGLLLYVNLSDGVIEENLPSQFLMPGWSSYSFSLYDFTGDLSSIQDVRILVTNVTVSVLFYVDDIHLLNHKAFDQTAYVNQTFTKPAQTSGQPNGVVLTFDFTVESAANATLFNASVKVNDTAGQFVWGKDFLSPSPWAPMYFDLSSNLTDPGPYQISLSLHVIVDTSFPCSSTLRFDNISIIWLDYTDGWLASRVFDATTHAVWENLSWNEGPQDPAYDISVRTRTGDIPNPGPSWSPWSPQLIDPSGQPILSPSGQYIQYNVSLTTTNGSLTPVLSELRILGWHYTSSGYAQTKWSFWPVEDLLGWRDFNASENVPAGCEIIYRYWNDSVPGWFQVIPGENLSLLDTQNVTLRADLSTTDTTVTPELFNMSLDYEFLGAIDHIVVVPGSWDGTADDTFDFNATAYDAYGHILDVTFTWNTTDPNGTISPDGLYTPSYVGSWTITATADGLQGNATANISAGELYRVDISPPSWSGTTDEWVNFGCSGFDEDHNPVAISPVWNTTDPGGVVGATGTYYPGSGNISGSIWTVYCNDSLTLMGDSAQVTVFSGPLHHVRVSPMSLGTITTDDNIMLYCYGYDFFDNFIGPVDADWSLSDNLGTITSERTFYAIFDPIVAGSTGNITCRNSTLFYSTTDDFYITEGVLATLFVVPSEVDMTAGERQQFMALGYDADGNEIPINQSQIVWTSNVGSVSQNELKAQTVSEYGCMNATLNGVTGSATVKVKPLPMTIWDAMFWPWSLIIIIALALVGLFAWRVFRGMYAVEDVFVVGNEGRLIAHRTRRLHADRDEDILAGMFTAIQEFVMDSFREGEQLNNFEFGDKTIVVQKGLHIYAATIFAGKTPTWAAASLDAFVSDFEKKYKFDEKKWTGDVSQLEGLEHMMSLIVGAKKYNEGDWEKKLRKF
jgi:hypothetical protein